MNQPLSSSGGGKGRRWVSEPPEEVCVVRASLLPPDRQRLVLSERGAARHVQWPHGSRLVRGCRLYLLAGETSLSVPCLLVRVIQLSRSFQLLPCDRPGGHVVHLTCPDSIFWMFLLLFLSGVLFGVVCAMTPQHSCLRWPRELKEAVQVAHNLPSPLWVGRSRGENVQRLC